MEQYIQKSALVAEIERRRSKNAKNKLNLAAAFEDSCLLSFIDTLEVKEVEAEPVSDFEMALTEMIANAQKCVVEPIVVAQQWKDYLVELSKSEKPVSEELEKHLWKPADGDDLPEIDREVIALLNNGKVVFAHRPYKGKYIGKNLTTGNIETFENKTYDKGGWNQHDIRWWLDVELPKEIEL